MFCRTNFIFKQVNSNNITHNHNMAEGTMDVDVGVIASAQEYETWEGRPGVGRHCAGCAQDDHALQTCKGPLTREGCLRGCPWCNSVEHSWDECKKKPVSVDLDYYFEVVLRRGRPPIEMKEDWRTKHLARVKAEGGGVSGGTGTVALDQGFCKPQPCETACLPWRSSR